MPILDEHEAIQHSPEFNKRIHFWNTVYRVSLITLSLIIASTVIFTARKVDDTIQEIKKTQEEIKKTQEAQIASTLEARAANQARQDNFEDYIKCLSLLRFENPKSIKTRAGVLKALNKCAAEH